MGAYGDIAEASFFYQHVEPACDLPFLLVREIPITPALMRAHLFLARCDGAAISSFRAKQIARVEAMVSDSRRTEALWSSHIPPDIMPPGGEKRVTPFLSSTQQDRSGRKRRPKQFIFGFPPVGRLSQRFTYPP